MNNGVMLESASEKDGQAAGLGQVSLRCGRTLPAVHLLEADSVLWSQQYHYRAAHTALCGAELDPRSSRSDDAEDDDEDCPGCRDCLRYCAACLRSAARFVEQPTGSEQPGSSR